MKSLSLERWQEALGGVPFDRFLKDTPKELQDLGLYKPLAISWYAGAYRQVSCQHALAALGVQRANQWSPSSWARTRAAFVSVANNVMSCMQQLGRGGQAATNDGSAPPSCRGDAAAGNERNTFVARCRVGAGREDVELERLDTKHGALPNERV